MPLLWWSKHRQYHSWDVIREPRRECRKAGHYLAIRQLWNFETCPCTRTWTCVWRHVCLSAWRHVCPQFAVWFWQMSIKRLWRHSSDVINAHLLDWQAGARTGSTRQSWWRQSQLSAVRSQTCPQTWRHTNREHLSITCHSNTRGRMSARARLKVSKFPIILQKPLKHAQKYFQRIVWKYM